MAKQDINYGAAANDATADTIRAGMQKAKENFDELYAFKDAPLVPSFTVATLPVATVAGRLILVTDEAGGAVIAFSDGTDWRRVTDRAVVS